MLLVVQQLLLFSTPAAQVPILYLTKPFVFMVFYLWTFEKEWRSVLVGGGKRRNQLDVYG